MTILFAYQYTLSYCCIDGGSCVVMIPYFRKGGEGHLLMVSYWSNVFAFHLLKQHPYLIPCSHVEFIIGCVLWEPLLMLVWRLLPTHWQGNVWLLRPGYGTVFDWESYASEWADPCVRWCWSNNVVTRRLGINNHIIEVIHCVGIYVHVCNRQYTCDVYWVFHWYLLSSKYNQYTTRYMSLSFGYLL